jgi:hypothetical protein
MNRYSLVDWGDCSEGGIPCQRQDGWMDEQDAKREDTEFPETRGQETWRPDEGFIGGT